MSKIPNQLENWQALQSESGQALMDLCLSLSPQARNDASQIEKLRRDWPTETVAAALQCCQARDKARRKKIQTISGAALFADIESAEQASSHDLATYKAKSLLRRLEKAGLMTQVMDLCCGMGADSLALTRANLLLAAVDKDPVRCWMTNENTGVAAYKIDLADESAIAKVDALIPDNQTITCCHMDPARRRDGKRYFNMEDLLPSPEVISRWLKRFPNSVIKLGPGTNRDELPWDGELEYIQENGKLVQLLLWTGKLAEDAKKATMITSDEESDCDYQVLQLTSDHFEPEDRPVINQEVLPRLGDGDDDWYLYEPVPVLERAAFWDADFLVSAPAPYYQLARGLGLLLSQNQSDSPWLNRFKVLAVLPWREKHVKKWLKANDGGIVEIKTRAKVVNPDVEQKRYKLGGKTLHTLFVLRLGKQVRTFVCKRA